MSKVVIAFDAETFPMGLEYGPYPPLVCIQWRDSRQSGPVMMGNNNKAALRARCIELLTVGHILVGANTQYDLHCIATTFPDLLPLIWKKVRANEVTDVSIREKFKNLATHGQLEYMDMPDGTQAHLLYSLGELIKHYTGKDRSAEKEDPNAPRANYYLMDKLPLERYPVEFRSYALEDADDTFTVYQHQEAYRSTEAYVTEFFRMQGAFALGCATRPGFRVDKPALNRLRERVAKDNADTKFPELITAGILRPSEPERPYARGVKNPDGTPKMKAAVKASVDQTNLMALVSAAFKERGQTPPSTPTGRVQIGVDVVKEVSDYHSALKEFVIRDEDKKLISTYIPQALWNDQPVDRVHAVFRPLVSTGRTSSGAGKDRKFPSMNGQNQDPRFRPIFVPRPDMWFVSADFKSLELVTTAQVTYNLTGRSKHMEKINAGFDLHAFLGSRLAAFLDETLAYLKPMDDDARYHAFMTLSKGSKSEKTKYKFWRKFAKPVGLGFPGGLGAEKFVTFAGNSPYEINLREFAPKYLHLFEWNSTIHYYADRMGLVKRGDDGKCMPWRMAEPAVAGLKIEDARTWPPHLQAIALAAHLKKLWHETYPEMEEYFKIIGGNEDTENEGKLFYKTPMGMIRRGCDYAAAMNGCCMQSPGAEGALLAMIDYAQACTDHTVGSILFGTNPLSFIHDELFGEVWEELAHEQAMEIKAIMERALKVVCPDVKVQADPCLMLRWDKMAEPVYDSSGRLTLWFPEDKWAEFEAPVPA
jgi:hypothetical protein